MTSSESTVRLAISTCPNDTFAFHALMQREVDWCGLDFRIEMLDIQQLNDGLFAGRFDVAKASFHAAVMLAHDTVVLPCGAALGFGVGPLLLAAEPKTNPCVEGSLTLCPGEHTTATLLFRMFYGNEPRVHHAVFSEIMPALCQHKADFGVCIHEGRFTWRDQGLACVTDLGTRWEEATQLPLPLGGILARRALPQDVLERATAVIGESIAWGQRNRAATLPTMRRYAQEFSDGVLFQHVDLYVNDWTLDLGAEGRTALHMLAQCAADLGLSDAHDLTVFAA